MSLTLLTQMQQRHAFDPTPAAGEIGHLHVPFDAMTGTRRCEHAFAEAIRRGERVALIGPSGAGKSSVTEHFLTAPNADLAPIRVRVGLEPVEVATEPAQFARHLVRTVARYVEDHDRRRPAKKADELARTAAGEAGRQLKVASKVSGGTPWLRGELAVDLASATKPAGPSGQEILEQAQLVLQIITARQRRPVLILDDTDHWLSRPGLPDPEQLIGGFFGKVLRMIAADLPAAAVIAIHDTYLAMPSYQDAAAFLESRVTIPEIPNSASLGRILALRAEHAVGAMGTIAPGHVIDDDALDRLFQNYASTGRSLRKQIQIAHGALTYAVDAGADTIGTGHVTLAIAD